MQKKVFTVSIIVVGLFLSCVLKAAPAIVSPNDYAIVPVLTDTMKGYLSDPEFLKTSTSYFSDKNTEKRREYKYEYTSNNSVPVTLTWSGTSGECIVKLWRTNKDTEAKPLFTKTVAGNSLKCYDLEVGRNYSWSVSDDIGTIIGHFFTEGTAPRIIRSIKDPSLKGADCSNGRDIGGWLTADGKKRVKQGLIYRSAYIEYCSPSGEEVYMPMGYLKDTLGIKLDLDLRTIDNIRMYKDWPCTWDTIDGIMDGDEILTQSSIGPGVVRCCIENETAGLGPNGNGIEFPNQTSFTSTLKNAKGETQSLKQNKIAVWTAFNKIYESAIVKSESVLFHCYQGKDRTGSLAFLIHGLLGVSQTDAKKDYGTALFCNDDSTMTYTSINNLYDKLVSYDTAETKTFQGGCEQYLISCGTEAGDSDAAVKVARFKLDMLEDVEMALEVEVEEEPEENLATRTVAIDGGYKIFGLGENRNETAVIFTRTGLSTWTVPIDIKNAQFLVVGGGGGGGADCNDDATSGGSGGGGGGVVTGEVDLTKGTTVTVTVGAGGAGGKVQTNQRDGASSGNYYGGSCKGGNSTLVVDDTVYVTAYGGGRDQGVTKSGTSSVTVANMTEGGQGGSNAGSRGGITAVQSTNPQMGVVASVETLHNCTTYGNKGGKGCSDSFYGFPSAGGGGGATEAGGDAGNDAQGWPGGKGGEGLASDITGVRLVYGSGGGGASTQGELGGEGGEGAGNGGDRSDPQGTSALVNQGGGGGGTSREATNGGAGGSGIVVVRYVSTHINNYIFADELESAVNASIDGKQFVYNGQVQTPLSDELLNSEKYIISGDPTAREAGTYTFAVTPNDGYAWDDETRTSKEFTWSILKIDPSYGYVKEIGDEVVVVFTNHTVVSSWTVPYDIYNAQFLVVGGGGGGGADARSSDASTGGAGGGGGGVVTGLVNFVEGDCLTVNVGAGGQGGSPGKSPTGFNNHFGASYPGEESQFSIDGLEMYVKAYGGGRDQGVSGNSSKYSTYTYYEGGKGGSNAGSRGNCKTEQSEAVAGVKNDVANRLIAIDLTLAHKGGNGESGSINYYGYPAAGGGGGALTAGSDGESYWQGNYDEPNFWRGGNGGEGLASSITGEELVYGSGGGGASTMGDYVALGGTGAGNGGNNNESTNYGQGTSALANQGGGGGGSSRKTANGGSGGSGIVVFRFNTVNHTVGLPVVENATWWYNGEEVSSSVLVGAGSNAKFILKADKGYVIVEGEEKSTEKTFTCESIRSDITVSVDGVSVEALPVIAEINGVKYTSFTDAIEEATDGAEIILLANVELLNDLNVNKNVTFILGDYTFTVPTDKKVTVVEGCMLTFTCAAGGLVVDGTIAVNGTLDVSQLSYGTSGLIAGNASSLTISSTGKVKLMSVLDSVSPNWMMADNGAFFNGTVSGAQLVQGDVTYTYANGLWATGDDVAVTMIESNGYTFNESFNSLSAALAAAQSGGTITLLNDVTGAGLVIEKPITIDFNGKVYAFESGVGDDAKCGFEILEANTVTLKNGTLEISESATDSLEAVIKNSGDLILQNVTVDGTIMFTSGSVKGDVEDNLVIPEELKLALDENGAYVLVAKDVLAAVGDKLFETLLEASAASKSGDTILLKKDVTIEESIQIPAGVTFNLNGYTVNVKSSLIINGTLSGAGTINLSSLEATVTGAQGLNVASAIENYKVVYANGVYSLEEIPAEFAAQVGTTKYTNLTAAFAALEKAGNLNNVTVQLIANSKEDVEVPAGFKGTIDLGGYILRGAIAANGSSNNIIELTIKNGYIRLEGRTKMGVIGGRYCKFIFNDLDLYTDCHGVILENNATCTVNSGTYVIGDKSGAYLFYLYNDSILGTFITCKATLTINGGKFSRVDVGGNESYAIQVSNKISDPIVNVYGGEFTGFDAVLNLGMSGSSYCNVYGGKYTGGIEVGTGNPTISGGWFNKNPASYVASGYCAVSTTANNKGPWTVVPYPEKDNGAAYTASYTPAAATALYENSTRSVAVKVNGEVQKGDNAIKAINDAVACFEDAISFNENAADLNVAVEVTEVNTEDPAASTVVVKRGDTGTPITLKTTPTAKYFHPETDSWDYTKPETGAVIFKIVFEAK